MDTWTFRRRSTADLGDRSRTCPRTTRAAVLVRCLALLAVCVLQAGCATKTCRTCAPVPPGQGPSPTTCGNFDESSREKLVAAIGNAQKPPQILMISGGGSYGAWGSGFLNGWSASPDGRPSFDLVTGSSTGAILGTWAFLGQEGDESARLAYTETTDSDVYDDALLSWVWFQPWRWGSIKPWVSIKNLGPLRKLFEKYTPMQQVEKVGRIYAEEGRMFLVGTTDINLGAFCLWDMGKLAAEMIGKDERGKQQVYRRYREIVMASSSNPGVFNPTTVDDDMHVDGGVRFQVFLLPTIRGAIRDGLDQWYHGKKSSAPPVTVTNGGVLSTPDCNAQPVAVRQRVHVIVNFPMTVPRMCTADNIYNIAQRSLTVTQIQAMIGNLYEARWQLEHELSSNGPWDFCITQIPDHVPTWPYADTFPKKAMQGLYATAVARAKQPDRWATGMPGNNVSPFPCAKP